MSSDDIRTGRTAANTIETALTPETPHVMHNWDTPDSLLLRVIETVAEETGQSHDEMEPLHSVLDVDALERLLDGDDSPVHITFSYEGCTITASNDGTVVVQPDT